jgi:hypothetical protein
MQKIMMTYLRQVDPRCQIQLCSRMILDDLRIKSIQGFLLMVQDVTGICGTLWNEQASCTVIRLSSILATPQIKAVELWASRKWRSSGLGPLAGWSLQPHSSSFFVNWEKCETLITHIKDTKRWIICTPPRHSSGLALSLWCTFHVLTMWPS